MARFLKIDLTPWKDMRRWFPFSAVNNERQKKAVVSFVMSLFVVVWVWGVGFSSRSFAASEMPAAYEQAKQDMDTLRKDSRRSAWREPWEDLAKSFLTIYTSQKNWSNRVAALFRSAESLEEIARHTSLRRDVELAESRYLDLVEKHPSSVLADDALLNAARLRLDARADKAGAARHLTRLLQKYEDGDMAPEARKLQEKLAAQNSPKENDDLRDDTQQSENTKESQAPPKKKVRLPVKTVLIDAGHGGKDPGTRHNGLEEREITLDLAKRVGGMLAARGLKVRYTRYANNGMSLEDRAGRVQNTNSDIMVSIHMNANTAKSIQGFETYYFDFAKTSAAARLAAAENAMSRHAFERFGKLSADRVIRIQAQASRRLARSVHLSTLGLLRDKKYPTRDGGIKTAPFLVLRKAGVPGILIEVGYCTNVVEAKLLDSSRYRNALAQGIASGILDYAAKK